VKKMAEKEKEIESLNYEDIEIIGEKMHENAYGEWR
jgi:hypothetical protein